MLRLKEKESMTIQPTLSLDQIHDASIRDNDVLLGRGGQTNKHLGNKRYRSIVLDHQEEYLKAKKKDKILIARKIVAIIHQNGGRFLKQGVLSNGQWEEVLDERARAKTSQALREGLDVRKKTSHNSKMPRRDSGSNSFDFPPRKRTKIAMSNLSAEPVSPSSPSLVSADGFGRDTPNMEHQIMYYPEPLHLVQYQRQLSQSDVKDFCAL